MAGSTSTPPPPTLGRYRVVRRLGAGGMAEVFLAKSTGAEGIEKVLVVKRVLPSFARSAKFQKMFVDEAKVAMRLNHPNIVQVYAFDQVKDEFLLAMEFVDGLDLGRIVTAARKRGGRVPYGVCAWVVSEASKGLDYAHTRKDDRGEPLDIVHRDVSPQNLLISYDGIVKVADFGIARASMVSEETGVIKGKFAYMSPEQSRGERVDRRSDVYALGVVLTELLMGRPMYPGQQGLDVLEQVRMGNITLPRQVDPKVPEELEAICKRALAYDREERYQSARALALDLTKWLHQQSAVFDAESVEKLIAELVPREVTSPEAAREIADRSSSTAATVAAAAVAGDRERRERRHVVVVAGVVRRRAGEGTLAGREAVGEEPARMLADIAYKADAVLSWPEGIDHDRRRFRFILGLGRTTVHDPLRASRLALDVLDALAGLSADLVVPVTASLGLSRGVVSTVREPSGRLLRYEPVGSVIDVSERIADAGAPGEILAAGDVYRLVRREFAFDDKGAREVIVASGQASSPTRGVRAYTLRGARTREERAADVLGLGSATGLVGRSLELRAIVEAYQETLTTKKSAVLAVVGDLGIGKSALANGAIEAFGGSPHVLRVECAFGASDVPFATTADVVRAACGVTDDSTAEQAKAQLAKAIAEIVPKEEDRDTVLVGLEPLVAPDAEVAHQAEAGEQSRAIVRAVRILLGSLAERGPVVVLVDALQWCDTPSLELISSLVRRPYDAPVVVLLCSRPDPRIEQVLSGVPRVDLGELEEDDRRNLIRARFQGASVAADVEQAIVDRAGGNPFFIDELVDALIERNVVTFEGEGDTRRVIRRPGASIVLPTTLEGAIAARLGDLPDEERIALRWLAVSGPGLRGGDLAAVAGHDMTAALESLVVRQYLSRRADAYHFPSAVVRQLAYESTDHGDRVRMHRRIGTHLASLGAAVPPARIARHLERAGDHVPAAEAYMLAGAAARAVYSNRDALRFYARALALLPPDAPGRFRAHEAREQILRVMGRRRDQLFELEAMRAVAERSGTPALRAVAHNRLARYELDGSRTAGVDALLRRALDAAIEADDRGAEVEALRLTVFLRREQGDVHGALDACDRALARAGLDPDQLAARATALVQRGILLWRIGRLDEALEADAEAWVIFHRLGLKGDEARALNSIGVGLATKGEYEDAITVIRASIALDRAIGDLIHLGMKLSNIGQLYAELGDVDQGLAFLRRALEAFEAIDTSTGRADALSAMAELLLEQLDDADSAAGALDDARIIAERTGDRYDLARERIVRAALEEHHGRHEQAEGAARDAVSIARGAGLIAYELIAISRQAEALARLGKREEAITAVGRCREGMRSQVSVERSERVHLALARALLLAGSRNEARKELEAAEAVLDARAKHIRDPELRTRYGGTRTVQAIREALASLAGT